MKTQEIIINNANRCRKFGYGISTEPTGVGMDIEEPRVPAYTGTFKMIQKQMNDDYRYLNSIQTTFKNTRWFYDGKPIAGVFTTGIIKSKDCECDPWKDKYCEKCNNLRSIVEYGEAWFSAEALGSEIEFSSSCNRSVQIRVEVDE